MERKTLWPLLGVSLLAIILLGLTAAFVTGPQRAIMAIHQSLVDEDPQALAKHVDFEAVREDAKAAIMKELMASQKQNGAAPDPADEASLMLGMGLANSLLEQMLTPHTVIALIHDRQEGSSLTLADKKERIKKYSSVDFVSLDTALVHIHDGSNALLDVRMKRSGLSWKVVGFSLPEGQTHPL